MFSSALSFLSFGYFGGSDEVTSSPPLAPDLKVAPNINNNVQPEAQITQIITCKDVQEAKKCLRDGEESLKVVSKYLKPKSDDAEAPELLQQLQTGKNLLKTVVKGEPHPRQKPLTVTVQQDTSSLAKKTTQVLTSMHASDNYQVAV